jgi:2-succinyl-5-enolpyruvyl-6-hydroxy-3-cyclohexene-1-carboxylate synthase
MKIKLEKMLFCTGARNHDLLKAFSGLDVSFEYDERMASFKALGLSKVSGNPVGICTTSGTAVAECIPAMLEAFYSQHPLILITGDRPKKLHGTGSPQTIEHEALTRSCRGSFFEIELKELPDLELNDIKYPVHINVLVDDTTPHSFSVTHHNSISAFGEFLHGKKKPLFLFSHEKESLRPLVEKFMSFKLPFYAESLSHAHDLSSIKTEKRLIELFESNYFDCVVRIGHTPLSKLWRLLEKKSLPVFHFDSRNLPGLSFGEIFQIHALELLRLDPFWHALRKLPPVEIEDQTFGELKSLCLKFSKSEISLLKKIEQSIPEESHVYLGNSLVVRFFELIQTKRLRIYGNRGVNGIDGQLATASGLAAGVIEPVTCILGDVTTFYDLSSLREMPSNLNLIIMNNRGGRIFDMLNLDRRIILEHEHDFKEITQGMKLTYSQDIRDVGKVQVLELFPDREQSHQMLKEWMP